VHVHERRPARVAARRLEQLPVDVDASLDVNMTGSGVTRRAEGKLARTRSAPTARIAPPAIGITAGTGGRCAVD